MKYDQSLCEKVIETMSQGKSLARVASDLGVARSTIYEWAQNHEEFADAIELGRDMALAHWEDMAYEVAKEGKGNAAVLNFQMKNRFRRDYQDSTSMTLSGGDDPIKTENKHTIEFIMPGGTDADNTDD